VIEKLMQKYVLLGSKPEEVKMHAVRDMGTGSIKFKFKQKVVLFFRAY
jgi:hypothetical protein